MLLITSGMSAPRTMNATSLYLQLLGVTTVPSIHDGKPLVCSNGCVSVADMPLDNLDCFIATAGLPCSILLFTSKAWQPISHFLLHQKAAEIDLDADTFACLQRVLLGSAVSLTIESDGSMALPDHLLEHAGIGETVNWRQLGSAIELLATSNSSR